MRKCAQAILEFILAFAAVTLLAMGIARIWTWFNANFASQQVAYQAQRYTAALPHGDTYANADYSDSRLPLTEEWVFKGAPTGKVGGVGPYGASTGLLQGVGCDQAALDNTRGTITSTAQMMKDRAKVLEQEADHMHSEHDRCVCTFSHFSGCLRSANPADRCFWYKIFGIHAQFKTGERVLKKAAKDVRAGAATLAAGAGGISDCPDMGTLTGE